MVEAIMHTATGREEETRQIEGENNQMNAVTWEHSRVSGLHSEYAVAREN